MVLGNVGMKESELKSAVQDYLETGRTMGKWYFDRLNSGTTIAEYKGGKRAIRMCRPGTFDFMVFFCGNPEAEFDDDLGFTLYFLELKSRTGKLRPEQINFGAEAKKHGAECFVIRSIDELKEVLPL